jgi:hypothetical protein
MSIRNIIIPTRINKTEAEFEADTTTVYSENKMLVSTDVFYEDTNQPRFKLANGVDIWEDLDYVPAGGSNMANDDLILDDDREHDAAGNSWSITDLRNLRFESTSTGSGDPAFGFDFNSGSASFSDMVARISIDGNTALPAFEMRGNKNASFGDAALSNVRLNVYYSVDGGTGLRVYTDQPNQKALQFQSDGANSTGITGQASGSGGVGAVLSGELLGAIIQTLSPSGNGARILGGSLVADYADAGAQNDASLLHLRTDHLAALMVNPITKTIRDLIPPSPGMIIYMEEYDMDNLEGLYLYTAVDGAWRRFTLDV